MPHLASVTGCTYNGLQPTHRHVVKRFCLRSSLELKALSIVRVVKTACYKVRKFRGLSAACPETSCLQNGTLAGLDVRASHNREEPVGLAMLMLSNVPRRKLRACHPEEPVACPTLEQAVKEPHACSKSAREPVIYAGARRIFYGTLKQSVAVVRCGRAILSQEGA